MIRWHPGTSNRDCSGTGHWGTTPGLILVYAHLNRIIRDRDVNVIYITGPVTAVRAWWPTPIWRAPTPRSTRASKSDVDGLRQLFRQYSFPGGIPSHVAAETPGSIHECGELGYTLVHAYGAAFDNPDLVGMRDGDGEAETGPLAASWHLHSEQRDRHFSRSRLPSSYFGGLGTRTFNQRGSGYRPTAPRIVILIPDRSKIHNSTSSTVELRCVGSVKKITPVASTITPITSQLNRSIRVVFTIRSNGIFPPEFALP